jgi:hypothetical protein
MKKLLLAILLITTVNLFAQEGYPISYLFANNPCDYSSGLADPSMRNSQTISAASFMLNIPMYQLGTNSDPSDLVNALFATPASGNAFNGLNVLICWEHAGIQNLMNTIIYTGAQTTPSRFDEAVSVAADQDTAASIFFGEVDIPNNICPDGYYTNQAPTTPTDSQLWPYWVTNKFDTIFWFNGVRTTDPLTDYRFTLYRGIQPCITCAAGCDLNICMFQVLSPDCAKSIKYTDTDGNSESNCKAPLAWATLP